MRTRTHLWTSALAGLICYPRSPKRALLLTVCGVLIDLDHLVLYGLRTGDHSLIGALLYDRYRNRPARPGDTRPRYGSLRSWLHEPALLPPLLLLARYIPVLRPAAIGIALHLLLDHSYLPTSWRVARRARGRCELCGAHGRPLKHHTIIHPLDGGHRGSANLVALCKPCYKRALESYPVYPPP
jgi:hypothetical protein